MDRRGVLKLGAGVASAFLFSGQFARSLASAPAALAKLPLGDGTAFGENAVLDQARALAKLPYAPPEDTIPQSFKDLDYDRYRAIRFKKDLALWADDHLGYTAELFSAGYIYRTPVTIFVVEAGQARALTYDPDFFTYGPEVTRPPENSKPGFSGFRLHAPIDRPDVMDEFAVYQGASYFRAKAAGQGYGASGRGLAINTAHPPADEFPIFRAYWLVKPAAGASLVTVYALLDSVSVAGAYKFSISAGHNTIMDVDCTLFPRAAIEYVGIAPLTSMFYAGPGGGYLADDARPRVHDSDGLLIANGKGERIWRPLINPRQVQFSAFSDMALKGFGLLQRERRADRYQDFDARYEARPSIWVEPQDSWGEGSVDLVELPAQTEYFDNIVAFWHPKDPLRAGQDYHIRYKLTWCSEPPLDGNLAVVTQTRAGGSPRTEGSRVFFVDFAGTEGLNLCDDFADLCSDKNENVELTASVGALSNIAIRRNLIAGGHRVSFEYRPAPGSFQADLRCALAVKGKRVSEVWLYRWAP